MIAVDSNILLDILIQHSDHRDSSLAYLEAVGQMDELIACEVVCSELASRFQNSNQLDEFLLELGVAYEPSRPEALHRSGVAFATYSRQRGGFRCAECGSPVDVKCPSCGSNVTRRQHVLADFMIGAHALVHAGRLLTRDRGYYGTYFPDLVLV